MADCIDGMGDPRDALIQRLLRENAELRRRIDRDTLTGLMSRRHFDERLEHEWRRAERFWTPLSLLAIDVEGIEAIGAEAGAEGVRRAFAWIGELLACGCRDVDIAARVGRTAFAIILPSTNRTGAEAEVLRLRAVLRQNPPPIHQVDLDLSFGLAVAFDDAQTPLELLMLADEAALLDKRGRIGHDVATVPSLGRPTWIDAA